MSIQTKKTLIFGAVLCLLGLGATALLNQKHPFLKELANTKLGSVVLKNISGINLRPATYEQKSIIQNLSRFYAYDMSKACGSEPGWAFPKDGLYGGHHVDRYWTDPNRHPFIIEIEGELGGFVLVNKIGSTPDVDWNIAEFFITGNFQRKGMGRQIALEVFKRFPGKIEIMILPCNKPALSFWRKVVKEYTKGQFTENRKDVPSRDPKDTIILSFKN